MNDSFPILPCPAKPLLVLKPPNLRLPVVQECHKLVIAYETPSQRARWTYKKSEQANASYSRTTNDEHCVYPRRKWRTVPKLFGREWRFSFFSLTVTCFFFFFFSVPHDLLFQIPFLKAFPTPLFLWYLLLLYAMTISRPIMNLYIRALSLLSRLKVIPRTFSSSFCFVDSFKKRHVYTLLNALLSFPLLLPPLAVIKVFS